jgi:myosin heavy subunit
VASLLGIHPQSLQYGLSRRTYLSHHGSVKSTCSAAGANSARDALAKALYVRTSVAIMRRINTLLKGVSGRSSPSKPHRHQHRSLSPTKTDTLAPLAESVVSIVDMFGFESNESNSLEQMCINWTSEKLQQYYTQTVFNNTIKSCESVVTLITKKNVQHVCGSCCYITIQCVYGIPLA